MALLDFIAAGTYTTIAILNYDYGGKQIDIQVKTFSDSTKTHMITTNVYQIQLNDDDCRHIKGTISDPPESPEAGDMFLVVDPNPDSALAYANNAILKYKDDLTMTFEFLGDGICIVDESTNDRYISGLEGTRTPAPDDHIIIDKAAWDAICGISIIDGDQASLLSCIYEYLKTLPEFSETTNG